MFNISKEKYTYGRMGHEMVKSGTFKKMIPNELFGSYKGKQWPVNA